jgi:hypothetical protein
MDEGSEQFEVLHNKEFGDLHMSRGIIRIVKSRTLRRMATNILLWHKLLLVCKNEHYKLVSAYLRHPCKHHKNIRLNCVHILTRVSLFR